MDICCECCVLSGRGICDELVTRPEESYRLRCVVVCDLETSWKRRPWTNGGCRAKNKQILYIQYAYKGHWPPHQVPQKIYSKSSVTGYLKRKNEKKNSMFYITFIHVPFRVLHKTLSDYTAVLLTLWAELWKSMGLLFLMDVVMAEQNNRRSQRTSDKPGGKR